MNKNTEAFLENLLNAIGPSGYEAEPAQVWESRAKTFADSVTRDLHGNTDAVVNTGGTPRVMLAGHIDEIGFIVTHIDDNGFLAFDAIGGWDPQVAQGQRVHIRGRKGHLTGVIGKKPIHLLDSSSRSKVVKLDEMWLDIGAPNKKAAEKLVAIGDPAVLAYRYEKLNKQLAVSKAFDNRAGAFVILEAARMLSELEPKAEIHAVATVQEEIGLRGAQTSAHGIKPDIGIAVDVTFATDHPGMADATKAWNSCKLGGGPVITRGPNVNPALFELLVKTAEEEKIPYQLNAEGRGTGTDANALQTSGAGTAAALISVPNRYMHSPVEMCSLDDLQHCARLMAQTVARIESAEQFVPF